MYSEACKDWENKNESAKLWSIFKLYFTKEHRGLRLIQIAVGNSGYRAGFNVYEDRHPHDNKNNHDNEEVPVNMNDFITVL